MQEVWRLMEYVGEGIDADGLDLGIQGREQVDVKGASCVCGLHSGMGDDGVINISHLGRQGVWRGTVEDIFTELDMLLELERKLG